MSLRENLWKPLLQAALPGTAQATAPGRPVLPELEALATGGSAEARLLNQAAAVAIYQRAGELPTRRLPAVAEAAPAEQRPVLPPERQKLWKRLTRQTARLRPEWRRLQQESLALFAAEGWRFPHHLLPELLELGNEARDDLSLREVLLPLLGERGLWLGGGPATALTVRAPWNWVVDWRLQELPLERSPAACGLLLRRRRRQDPVLGREMLEASWPDASAALRTALLPALLPGLSLADEPLLEQALDDKRREVREQARLLLARLDGSAYVRRMEARIAAGLQLRPLKKGAGVELELKAPAWPESAAEAAEWQRDGFEKPAFASASGRLLIAEDLLKACPPAWWLRHLDCDRERLLALIEASPQHKALGSGLIGSVLGFGDGKTAAALLRQPSIWQRQPAARLLPLALAPLLPMAELEQHCLARLTGPSDLPEEVWSLGHDDEVSPAFWPAYFRAAARAQPEAERLLPAFLLLNAAPQQLPAWLNFVRAELSPRFAEASEAQRRDFDERLELLACRCELYIVSETIPRESLT